MNKPRRRPRKPVLKSASPSISKQKKSKYMPLSKKIRVQLSFRNPASPLNDLDQPPIPCDDIVPMEVIAAETAASQVHSYMEEPGKYDVFRFPGIDWDGRWLRPQHISQQFAQHGHRVFYMTTGVTALRKENATYEEVARHVKIKRIEPNIWLVTLCANQYLDLNKDQMSAADIQYLSWSVDNVRDRFQVKHLVSIVDLPFWAPLVTAMENHKLLYDCMGEHYGFATNDKTVPGHEEDLARKSDLVLASSQLEYGRMQAVHSSTLFLRNTAVTEEPAILTQTPEAFEHEMERSLQEKDPQQMDERLTNVRADTWEIRYQELHQAIMQQLYPKVSIVILTHNNWACTRKCLLSLQKPYRYPNLEIIMIDNGSTDETPHHLSELDPDLFRIIYSSSNLGFAAGYSLGCRKATGDYIILLNDDTIVPDESWIQRLIQPLEKNPEVGMSGPMSNLASNEQAIDHFVGNPVEGANPQWLHDFYQFNKSAYRYTEHLDFFCVAMKRSVFEKIGGLDGKYSISIFEDDDYCERVKRAGYRLLIIEDAFVYHHDSATNKQLKPNEYDADALWQNNKAYYEQKWSKNWQLPKQPNNLFVGAETPEEIGGRLKKVDQKCILVLGGREWSRRNTRWQQLVKQLAASKEAIVIVHLTKYYHHDFGGVRKAGPQLYLTNRLDLFCSVPFEYILYCGENEVFSSNQPQHEVIDFLSYHAQQLEDLRIKLKDYTILDELQVPLLVHQLQEEKPSLENEGFPS